METDFKCNSFKCRKPLPCDAEAKAVVTTCSHIFCVPCANEVFSASQICPACETSLTEPDDIVMCSLRPTNDYKTTILAGLNPVTVLEICGRAISFWNYQVQQEHSYQHAMFKNANEKMAQMQKQLDNVIREANGQISLLNDKVTGLERELDLERRRGFDLQETSRERDKEYQKLKNQLDKYKRKTLLGQNPTMATAGFDGQALNESPPGFHGNSSQPIFGGGNPLMATPSRRQNDFPPDMIPTIHASRSRPQRLNPVDPRYPLGSGFRNTSPTESIQGNRAMGYGTRPHRHVPVRLAQPRQDGQSQSMHFAPASMLSSNASNARSSRRRPSEYQNTFAA